MNTLYYIDNIGDRHEFKLQDHALQGIKKEYNTIENWLNNIGICFTECGVE